MAQAANAMQRSPLQASTVACGRIYVPRKQMTVDLGVYKFNASTECSSYQQLPTGAHIGLINDIAGRAAESASCSTKPAMLCACCRTVQHAHSCLANNTVAPILSSHASLLLCSLHGGMRAGP